MAAEGLAVMGKLAELSKGAPKAPDISVGRGAAFAGNLESKMHMGAHSAVKDLAKTEIPKIDIKAPTTAEAISGGAGMKPPEGITAPAAAAGGEGGGPPKPPLETAAAAAGGEPPKAEGRSAVAAGAGEAPQPGVDAKGGAPEDTPKGAEGADKPEGAEKATEASQNLTDGEKTKLEALNSKDDAELSPSERNERNSLRKKAETEKTEAANEGKRFDELSKRQQEGEVLSDEEVKFMEEFEEKRAENIDAQSQEALSAADELKELGHDALTKMANGDPDAQEAVDKFKEKYSEANPTNTPPDNFSELVKKALSKEAGKRDEKESREIKQMRDKLGDLIRLEQELMVAAQRLEQLQQEYGKTKNQLKELGGPSHRFDKDQERRMQRYQLMNHLITIQSEGKKALMSKYEIKAQYSSTKAYLDRKLGIHGIIGLIKDYGVAGYHNVNASVHSEGDWLNSDVMDLAA